MGLVAACFRDFAAGAYPLAQLPVFDVYVVGYKVVLVFHLFLSIYKSGRTDQVGTVIQSLRFKGTPRLRRRGQLLRRRRIGHFGVMLDFRLAATIRGIEAQRGGENGTSALSRLHGSGGIASAGADALHVVDNGDLGVARKHKVAVHAVHEEVLGHRELCGGEALRYDGAAVDAACAGRMP
jgi:hypothetical protein